MKNVLQALIVGFSEILKWETIRIVLLTGGVVTLFWIGLGYLLWDSLIVVSRMIIDYIPFSMIRSNGAWFLSVFFWFQMVLITFALIYAFFGNLIMAKLSKDKYATFTFMTILLSALFWGVVWFVMSDQIHQIFNRMLSTFPFDTIQNLLAVLVGLYIIYNGIIITMLFVASLFSEPIIRHLAKKHFSETDIVKENRFISVRYTVKDTLVYLLMSMLAFPLLFIPVINVIVQIVLWIWLYKDTISFDAVALVYKKPDRNLIKSHRFAVWFISFVTVLFNFLPVFNIFGPFFGEIAMYHYFKTLKNDEEKI